MWLLHWQGASLQVHCVAVAEFYTFTIETMKQWKEKCHAGDEASRVVDQNDLMYALLKWPTVGHVV